MRKDRLSIDGIIWFGFSIVLMKTESSGKSNQELHLTYKSTKRQQSFNHSTLTSIHTLVFFSLYEFALFTRLFVWWFVCVWV